MIVIVIVIVTVTAIVIVIVFAIVGLCILLVLFRLLFPWMCSFYLEACNVGCPFLKIRFWRWTIYIPSKLSIEM